MLLPHDAMRLMHHVWSGGLAATTEPAINRHVDRKPADLGFGDEDLRQGCYGGKDRLTLVIPDAIDPPRSLTWR
ncbi:hypothetical protein ASG03_05155 [Rhizobium sp. Leaf341]|nr:hypothetical protein ASG03_05155 [Rhizobium sp. Leaf341]